MPPPDQPGPKIGCNCCLIVNQHVKHKGGHRHAVILVKGSARLVRMSSMAEPIWKTADAPVLP
jgi:hypothetical protein